MGVEEEEFGKYAEDCSRLTLPPGCYALTYPTIYVHEYRGYYNKSILDAIYTHDGERN